MIGFTRLGGPAFNPEHKLRAGENPPERHFNSVIKATLVAPGLVETHQGFKVLIGHRSSKGTACQCRNDFFSARQFLLCAFRMANKYLPAAGRVPSAHDFEGSGKCNAAD